MNTYRHYLIVNMPYSLLHFLITKKALKLYLTCTLEYITTYTSQRIIKSNIVEYTKMFIQAINTSLERSIKEAFIWKNTKQGFEYWYEINKEFLIYLKNEKENNIHIS